MILYIKTLSENSRENSRKDGCEVGREVSRGIACELACGYIKTIVITFEIIASYFLACWKPWSRRCRWRH